MDTLKKDTKEEISIFVELTCLREKLVALLR